MDHRHIRCARAMFLKVFHVLSYGSVSHSTSILKLLCVHVIPYEYVVCA